MKVNQMVALNEDARDMLREQAKEVGLSVSNYVERLILEKEWARKNATKHEITDADFESGEEWFD